MGILKDTVSTYGADLLASRIEDLAQEYDRLFWVPRFIKDVHEFIHNKYGEEAYYDLLDKYITHNNVIQNLVQNIQGANEIVPKNKNEFAQHHTERLLEQIEPKDSNRIQKKDILEFFSWLFDYVFKTINHINSRTDAGKLQNEIRRMESSMVWRIEQLEARIFDSSGQALIPKATIPLDGVSNDEKSTGSSPLVVKEFENKIKSIENEYQKQRCFNDAIDQYFSLFQQIYARKKELGQAADTLICSLNCNIALCHTNLGRINKAYESLELIPYKTAEKSKAFHYVYAIITIQANRIEDYSDALEHLEKAIDIDPLYHKAYLLKHLCIAHLRNMSCEENISILSEHFNDILKEQKNQELITHFYSDRGLIYLAYGKANAAVDDLKKSLEYGNDGIVSKFNLASALYSKGISSLPKDQRLFRPSIDSTAIVEAISLLKPIVTSQDIDSPAYQPIAKKAVALYVSSCILLGIPHELTPIRKYLNLSDDYETTRSLLFGTQEELTEDDLLMLNDEDQQYVRIQNMLKNEDYITCKNTLKESIDTLPMSSAAPYFHMLLQVLLVLKDSGEYWRVRNTAQSSGIKANCLDALDAYAYELEDNLKEAKAIFDRISSNSLEYDFLENTLRFYLRHDFQRECILLYLRVHELFKQKRILIDNPNDFYLNAVRFLTSVYSSETESFVNGIDEYAISKYNYLKIKVMYLNMINDTGQLADYLFQMFSERNDVRDGLNLANCQIRIMKYDDALSTCQKLLKLTMNENEFVELFRMLSDIYLFKEKLEESCSWAKKAHEKAIQNPYNISHQAYFTRLMRCGKIDDLVQLIEYKNTHPVAVDWIDIINLRDDENIVETIQRHVGRKSSKSKNPEREEVNIEAIYKQKTIPINLLLTYFDYNLSAFFAFAKKNKIRISSGNIKSMHSEVEKIGDHLVVDAQTLIIMAYHECLEALNGIQHVHMNYGTLSTLQNHHLLSSYPYIYTLMKWIEKSENIVFHADGYLQVETELITALSRDFYACCGIALKLDIPLLYSDYVTPMCASFPEFKGIQGVNCVSIPALCHHHGKTSLVEQEQMLYRLLNGCTFINFTANTILQTLRDTEFESLNETLERFLICKSDYDMMSFAEVYLKALSLVCSEKSDAVLSFAEILLDNTIKVWRRGTSDRVWAVEYNVARSMDKAVRISSYALHMINGIKNIIPDLPTELKRKCEAFEKQVYPEKRIK